MQSNVTGNKVFKWIVLPNLKIFSIISYCYFPGDAYIFHYFNLVRFCCSAYIQIIMTLEESVQHVVMTAIQEVRLILFSVFKWSFIYFLYKRKKMNIKAFCIDYSL